MTVGSIQFDSIFSAADSLRVADASGLAPLSFNPPSPESLGRFLASMSDDKQEVGSIRLAMESIAQNMSSPGSVVVPAPAERPTTIADVPAVRVIVVEKPVVGAPFAATVAPVATSPVVEAPVAEKPVVALATRPATTAELSIAKAQVVEPPVVKTQVVEPPVVEKRIVEAPIVPAAPVTPVVETLVVEKPVAEVSIAPAAPATPAAPVKASCRSASNTSCARRASCRDACR